MKLIFIHGRAQSFNQTGLQSEKIRQRWIETLKIGLKKNKFDLPISEEQIIFPYYGNLLDDLARQYESRLNDVIEKGVPEDKNQSRFYQDFLEEIAQNANITTDGIYSENTEQYIEKGPLNWSWIHSILRAIDKKTPWGETTLKKFTYDVFLYLTIPSIRKTIDNEVKQYFNNEPCVVVGHSLGSIVSYNVLSDLSDKNVRKLITIGSPLGVRAIKNKLSNPVKMPKGIANGWFNAYDSQDIVALNPLDKIHFDTTPEIENKSDVINKTNNRHGIEGYLNDKFVAKEIYNALIS